MTDDYLSRLSGFLGQQPQKSRMATSTPMPDSGDPMASPHQAYEAGTPDPYKSVSQGQGLGDDADGMMALASAQVGLKPRGARQPGARSRWPR